MAKRKIMLPGSYGGLFTISETETVGIKVKPKEVIILTILLVIIVWILNLVF